jgi:hypothetical protein
MLVRFMAKQLPIKLPIGFLGRRLCRSGGVGHHGLLGQVAGEPDVVIAGNHNYVVRPESQDTRPDRLNLAS